MSGSGSEARDPGERDFDDPTGFVVTGTSGEYIFREGEPGGRMYIVQEGEIEILKSRGDEERRVAVLRPGDFFGELSLLEEAPREVSARALTDYKLLEIDRPAFDRIVEELPEIPVQMVRRLASRLHRGWGVERGAPAAVPAPAAAAMPADAAPSAEAPPGPVPSEPARAALVHEVSGTEFPIPPKPEATVGRVDRVTGITPDMDFSGVDAMRTLSRRHAKILRRDGDFYLLEETSTTNGTFVNGKRVETGVPVKLQDGDRIRFGTVETVFKCG